jgi:predicted aspartyl protease
MIPLLSSVLVLGAGSAASTAASTAQSLHERARAAHGPWPKDAQLEARGKAHASGIDGTLEVRFDGDGRFRIDFDSALPQGSAFDGTRVWEHDPMGLERTLALEQADRAKLVAWVLSGHWAEAREVLVSAAGNADAAGNAGAAPQLELALENTPMSMTLTLDRSTFLPSALDYLDASGPVRWTFGDWRATGGRKLPCSWTFDEGSGPDTYSVEGFASKTRDAASFRSAFPTPGDVRFDPEAEPELDVIRVATGHLLVEPWLEGGPVGMFIFDTGAGGMTIDPKVADELGLPELGEVLAVGVGGKTKSSFRRGTEFQLGPLTLTDPVYVELDLSFLEPIFGHKIAGVVGYDCLARCVAEIETRTPYVALHDPKSFTLDGARWEELLLNENTPCAKARFEGDHEGLFRLDTGANGTLAFHTPAVREFKLLEGRTVTSGANGGVGGSTEVKNGTIAWFELAGHRFEKPMVAFALAEKGAFTDRYTLGNIGQDFLAPFRMVLDYPHDRIAFAPLGK